MPFRPGPKTDAERDAQQKRIDAIMAAKAKALDFTNVKERSYNIKHLPEGDYPAKVLKVDGGKSKKTGNDMWIFTIGLTGGGPGTAGASFPYYCTLDTDSLWKVRNLFAACGLNIPKKRVNLDPNKAVGRSLGVTLEDDEYEGKLKSVIAATIPLSDMQPADEDEDEDEEADEVEEEEAPAPKAKKKKKAKKPPVEDDDELEELEIEEL